MWFDMSSLANPDPLGVGLRSRAKERRWGNFARSGNMRDLDAGFMSPQWDGFFEAMREKGIERMAVDSTEAFAPLSPGNHISTAALDGFAQAAGLPMPETHEQWMARQQQMGRGRGQTKLPVNGQRGGTAAR